MLCDLGPLQQEAATKATVTETTTDIYTARSSDERSAHCTAVCRLAESLEDNLHDKEYTQRAASLPSLGPKRVGTASLPGCLVLV